MSSSLDSLSASLARIVQRFQRHTEPKQHYKQDAKM